MKAFFYYYFIPAISSFRCRQTFSFWIKKKKESLYIYISWYLNSVKRKNPFTEIIPGSDAVKLYSNILCLITMYIWCLNSFFLCDDETTQVSLTSFFVILFSFFSQNVLFFFFKKRVWRHLFRAFSLAPSICIALGLFSYDCKNESSSHQLKYFIFTALTASWLSLLVISASLFVTHTAHPSPQQTPDWKGSFCLFEGASCHIL